MNATASKFFKQRGLVAALASAAFIVGFASPAQALLQLSISDGTDSIVITDQGSDDSDNVAGQIEFNNIGNVWGSTNWDIDAEGGISVGSTNDGQSINSTADGIGTLTLMLTQTDVTNSGGLFFSSLTYLPFTNAFTPWASIDYTTYLDENNLAFTDTLGFGVTVVPTLSLASGGGAASTNDFFSSGTLATYSVTQVLTLTHTTEGKSFMAASISTVPEPGALVLVAFGLLFAGLRARRNS